MISKKLLTYDPKKGKNVLVGTITGTTLLREVTEKHFMRVVGGYGIQEPALQQARSLGVKTIIQIVKETNEKWIGTIDNWINNSKTMDFGHGKQVFLSLKYMTLLVTIPLENTKGGAKH
jgi:hypothetical protein